jgi:hypothetical protein
MAKVLISCRGVPGAERKSRFIFLLVVINL